MKLSTIVPLALGGAATLQGLDARPATPSAQLATGAPIAGSTRRKPASVPSRRQLDVPPGVTLPQVDGCVHVLGLTGSTLLAGAGSALLGTVGGYQLDKFMNRQVSYAGLFKLGGAAVGWTAGTTAGLLGARLAKCPTDVEPSPYVYTNANDCVNFADAALLAMGSGAVAASLASAGLQVGRVTDVGRNIAVPLGTGTAAAFVAYMTTVLRKKECYSDFIGRPEVTA